MKLSTKASLRMSFVKLLDFIKRVPFARPTDNFPAMPYSITVNQPLLPSPTLENKKHNLCVAADRINNLLIRPGEVFSFWHTVGNPNDQTRFREGRSIHAGRVTFDVGGGLCQASGIIHHAALLAGLHILERYNHSVDLYTEISRFAPIGTDATVFYGFKDLRFRNNTDGNIRLQLEIDTDKVTLHMSSNIPIHPRSLSTDIKISPDGNKMVSIADTTTLRIVSTSLYRPLP